jgi:hypothetical protein
VQTNFQQANYADEFGNHETHDAHENWLAEILVAKIFRLNFPSSFRGLKPTATFTTSLRDSLVLSHWQIGTSLEFCHWSLVIHPRQFLLASPNRPILIYFWQ